MDNDIFSLNDKNIIVTGGAGFLASNFIPILLNYNANIILIDIDQSKLNQIKHSYIEKYPNKIHIFALDITNENKVKYFSKIIYENFSNIDGVVNNAANNPKIEGIENNFKYSGLENFSLDVWKKDINVSLTGSFLMTKYFGNMMSKNKYGGSIVNISSDLGVISPDQRIYEDFLDKENNRYFKPVSYSVVKSGLIGLTKYTATYWPTKVRCNAICPGGVENGQSKDFLEKVCKNIPLNRLAQKDELNGIMVYLLSNSSSYMNGAIINIDGGRTTW